VSEAVGLGARLEDVAAESEPVDDGGAPGHLAVEDEDGCPSLLEALPNAGRDCLQHLVIGHAADDRRCRDSAEREERIGSNCIELLRSCEPISTGER
jgi:hypothetical protein